MQPSPRSLPCGSQERKGHRADVTIGPSPRGILFTTRDRRASPVPIKNPATQEEWQGNHKSPPAIFRRRSRRRLVRLAFPRRSRCPIPFWYAGLWDRCTEFRQIAEYPRNRCRTKSPAKYIARPGNPTAHLRSSWLRNRLSTFHSSPRWRHICSCRLVPRSMPPHCASMRPERCRKSFPPA